MGTRIVASSSIPPPHLGRVIMDLFRLLHAVRHGTEALVYSDHQRKAAISTSLAIVFWVDFQLRTLVPPRNRGANAAATPVQTLVLAVV